MITENLFIFYPFIDFKGIGVIFITAFSVLLFNELLPPMKLIGLALVIVGIALIKSGTKKLAHYIR